MKTKPLSWWCLISLTAFSVFGSTLCAERDDERPSTERVLAFLEEKMPEALHLVERVREEEGEEEYEEVLERAAEILMDYLEIEGEEGIEVAEIFLEEERNMIRIDSLVEAWHETDEEEEKRALEKEIAELIGEQIDLELVYGRRELEELEAEVDEFRRELDEIEENRETIIAEELEEILSDEEDD